MSNTTKNTASDMPSFSDKFTIKLTARQQQILELIQNSIARTGSPPTRAEIATEFGFKSANASEEHLKALARKGAIELVSGTSRGIRLKGDSLQSINASRSKQFKEQFSLPIPSLLQLPLIGRVAAGNPILAQEHVEQSYSAGIMDGDLLAVQSAKDARNGQIVVARLGEEVTVKRYRRTQNLIELLPENPDFKIITVDPEEPFAIEGLAVGLIRNTFMM
jgi:repressor LexA